MTIFAPVTKWLEPRTTDPNQKFREKTIRALVPVLLILVSLAWLVSFFYFKEKWDFSSYLTAETISGILLVATAVMVHKRRITTASYLLVSTFMFFSTYVPLFSLGNPVSFSGFYVITLVVVTLVMPRSSIPLFTGLSILAIVLIFVSRGTYSDSSSGNTTGALINGVLTIAAVAVLLYSLRREYEEKLLDTEASRRQTEQALKIAELKTAEAERANSAKSAFLSTMSHELRTPLGAILGFVGILENNMIKPKDEARELSNTQKKMLQDIKNNGQALLDLINGILDLTRVSSGRIQANLKPVNPCDESFLIGTVSSLRSLAISKNIELEISFDPNIPTCVNCDVPQIKQVVKNLVGNAIKFTDHGSIRVQVSSVDGDKWKISVRDTGVGIPQEALKHVFDPFYQADSSDTRAREGTGLGLAISKSYVELHQGSIQAESVVGSGTTFTIRLPLEPKPSQSS